MAVPQPGGVQPNEALQDTGATFNPLFSKVQLAGGLVEFQEPVDFMRSTILERLKKSDYMQKAFEVFMK